jgi:hypothetical protein
MDALVGASGRTYTQLPIDGSRGFPQSFPLLFEGRTYQFRLYINVSASLLNNKSNSLSYSARTILSSPINANATTITVTSTASFPSSIPFGVRIDDEVMIVTAMAGTSWTVTRGVDGTTATPHANAALVVYNSAILDLPFPDTFLVVQVEVQLPDTTRQTLFLRKVVTSLEYEAENIALVFPQQRVAVSNLNGQGDFGSQVIGGIAPRWA